MIALRDRGDSIEGKKIYYCFGRVTTSSAGGGIKGTLSLRGYAHVVKPLKQNRAARVSRERPRIECKSARFEAGRIREEKAKVACHNHRCFEGYLVERAKCTIQVPFGDALQAG